MTIKDYFKIVDENQEVEVYLKDRLLFIGLAFNLPIRLENFLISNVRNYILNDKVVSFIYIKRGTNHGLDL